MSFAFTPLAQSRRTDYNTFFEGKDKRPVSPQRPIPTSYSHGGPTTATRSPPKPSRDTNNDNQDSALTRFARLKQPPTESVASPHPEKWSVKDTSVNIASAFHQAANQTMNPNNSWASGANRPKAHVPRSTSVEYENQIQNQMHRRLAPPPPSRGGPPPSRTTARKPVSKTTSLQHVSDSEPEDVEQSQNSYTRGKSPFDSAINMAGRAAFFLKEKLQAAGDLSHTSNGKDNSYSYDYSAEEREVQADNSNQSASRRTANAHKRGRMSMDNKAYKPSKSDLEDSDEDISDDGKKRRRKAKKKEPGGGPLTTLPVTQYDKRKKKRPRKQKNGADASLDGDQESESEDTSEQQPPPPRLGSLQPTSRLSARGSVPREIVDVDASISIDDAEQGLKTIPEVEERPPVVKAAPQVAVSRHSRPLRKPRPRSFGAFLGKTCRSMYGLVLMLSHVLGTVMGSIFDILIYRPFKAVSSFSPGPLLPLITLLTLAALAIYSLSGSIPSNFSFPSWSSNRVYHAPTAPAANMADFSDRLLRVENFLSTLSADTERALTRQESDSKVHSDFASRVSSLETRLLRELAKAADVEAQSRSSATQGMQSLKRDMEILHNMFQQAQNEPRPAAENPITDASDEEAREKLRLLEERVGSIEGGVKEALEMGKNSLKANTGVSGIWKSLGGSKNSLTIKSSDGQDVTSLIGRLVDSAVSLHGKDGIARPDFALWSGGAAVVPSLTSPILEFVPKSLTQKALGLFGGDGYAVGNPPVTALHYDINPGRCWPFAGTEGQLGVKLAAPVYIDEVTIDHAAKEVVLHESELRSAPRDMELWGLVEGQDNLDKIREWRAERDRRRLEAEERGDPLDDSLVEPPYPRTLPKSAPYIRIARFTYDVHAPHNIQTSPVLPEIKELGIDFGIVALRILNNWGRSDYTCVYRMRVHGTRLDASDAPPLPTIEELQ